MFYDNFIKECNRIGKSPSSVVIDCGISKPAVTRWRKGEMPRDATLRKLADYFGVSVSSLKEETNLKLSKVEIVDTNLSAEALSVAKAFDCADKRTKDMVRLALEPFGLSVASDEAI